MHVIFKISFMTITNMMIGRFLLPNLESKISGKKSKFVCRKFTISYPINDINLVLSESIVLSEHYRL